MPDIGAPELILLALVFVPSLGIGVWCETIYENKGRSRLAGFLLGFLLTFFLSVFGAAIAVIISYTRPAARIETTPPVPRAPT